MKLAETQERYPSPLRYPGGKAKVSNFLKLLISHNSLSNVEYIEPYAGGASVALALLFDGYADRIRINDLNKGVHAFWKLALTDAEKLCDRIQAVKLDVDEWRQQKETYENPKSSPEDLGFATFFLNRTNRSGIITRGGVIGGLNQQGNWKIDARFNRDALCERVRKIASYKSRISVTRKDAAKLLRDVDSDSKYTRLLYLDPPYYVKGARLYDNFYQHDDHVKICDLIKRLETRWIVSYDAAPEILSLYNGYPNIRYSLGYSASTVASGAEVMFFSENLMIPQVASPAGISRAKANQLRLAVEA
ncbi:DNA adenine methylase [Kutzneria kofuensis]